MTVKRVWRGWATHDAADRYEAVVLGEVIPGILAKRIPGFLHIELLREDLGDEVEFSTIMTFESLDAVIAFQGEDYAACYVPDAARAVLSRWDERSRHYERRAAYSIDT